MAASNETSDYLTILEAFCADIDTLTLKQKGKQRAGQVTDFELALSVLRGEVHASQQLLYDRMMAESLAQATVDDEAVMLEEFAAEARIMKGRKVIKSPRRANGNFIPTLSKLDINAELNNGHNDDLETEPVVSEATSTRTFFEPGPSRALGTLRHAETRFGTLVCNTCTDRAPISLTLKAKCGHVYCRDCIIQLFIHATTDETLYPPRCCRNPFPVEKVLEWMKAKDGDKFRAAAVEYEATDRTYCSNPTCAVFITGKAHGVVDCQSCGTRTCSQCKSPDHGALDCPKDEALQVVLKIAEDAGWKRCTRCHTMVELTLGCNHITCKCGAQWCYLCSAPWKTCSCVRWQEPNLLARAEEIVDRQVHGIEPINIVERNRRIEDMRDHLENEDDNCAHPGRWRMVEGRPGRKGYRCEFCHERHWKFILECRRCFVRACQECRTHRV